MYVIAVQTSSGKDAGCMMEGHRPSAEGASDEAP